MQNLLLAEQLDRSIAGAVNPDLRAGPDAETVLEPDLRPGVEPEEIGHEILERTFTKPARKAVRDPERAAEAWNPQRRRQRHDREVRLRRVHRAIARRLRRRRRVLPGDQRDGRQPRN